MAEIFKSQKHVFWQALILALFVFSAGVLLGFVLENSRTAKIQDLYFQSDLDLMDIRIQNEIYSFSTLDCEKAIEENIAFADRVYEEAKLLDRFEEASRLSESLVLQHKKYDLLRALFWMNAIKIKQRCGNKYHNIVYFYDYINPSLDIEAKQYAISHLLQELKNKYGDEIMLIPMAGDNNLTSINLLMSQFDIKEQELPVILIDEKHKIVELQKIEEIEKLL